LRRLFLCLSLALLALPAFLQAQLVAYQSPASPNLTVPGLAGLGTFNFSTATDGGSLTAANLEPLGGGGGQVEPSATEKQSFTRLTIRSGISPLGTGGELATNVNPHLDLRVIGHYTNFTYNFQQSGFNIGINIGFANTGAYVDYYPFHKAFRISPGYLFYNTDRVRADLLAGPGATFTINNIDWHSDNADPVNGTGRLLLMGSGFLLTGGYGHIVSRTRKHFSFPFEAGVAFIDTPTAQFYLNGKICTPQGTHCEAANNYPGFASNLAIQIADWNKRLAPFHIYPLIEGGVAYTFRIRK
jgi:hypothetical protein